MDGFRSTVYLREIILNCRFKATTQNIRDRTSCGVRTTLTITISFLFDAPEQILSVDELNIFCLTLTFVAKKLKRVARPPEGLRVSRIENCISTVHLFLHAQSSQFLKIKELPLSSFLIIDKFLSIQQKTLTYLNHVFVTVAMVLRIPMQNIPSGGTKGNHELAVQSLQNNKKEKTLTIASILFLLHNLGNTKKLFVSVLFGYVGIDTKQPVCLKMSLSFCLWTTIIKSFKRFPSFRFST